MNYYNLIPSELNEIIVSYLFSDELKTLLNTFILHVNWNTVHLYHFNAYKSTSVSEYLIKLGVERLRDKLRLNYTVDQLINLQVLHLSYNQLTQVPPEIGNLTNLQILHLTGNQLTQVPPEIGNLTNLRQLFLGNNQVTQVPPEIGNLTNLQELSLMYNFNIKIPENIKKLPHLNIYK